MNEHMSFNMPVQAKMKLCLFSFSRENKINQIKSRAAWHWPEGSTITVSSYFNKPHDMQNMIKVCHWCFAQMVTPDLMLQNHMEFSRFFPRTPNSKLQNPPPKKKRPK